MVKLYPDYPKFDAKKNAVYYRRAQIENFISQLSHSSKQPDFNFPIIQLLQALHTFRKETVEENVSDETIQFYLNEVKLKIALCNQCKIFQSKEESGRTYLDNAIAYAKESARRRLVRLKRDNNPALAKLISEDGLPHAAIRFKKEDFEPIAHEGKGGNFGICQPNKAINPQKLRELDLLGDNDVVIIKKLKKVDPTAIKFFIQEGLNAQYASQGQGQDYYFAKTTLGQIDDDYALFMYPEQTGSLEFLQMHSSNPNLDPKRVLAKMMSDAWQGVKESLERKKVMHLDLGARNFLVSVDVRGVIHVRICDFGFSEKFNDLDEKKIINNRTQIRPWRWMNQEAVESLMKSKQTEFIATPKLDIYGLCITFLEWFATYSRLDNYIIFNGRSATEFLEDLRREGDGYQKEAMLKELQGHIKHALGNLYLSFEEKRHLEEMHQFSIDMEPFLTHQAKSSQSMTDYIHECDKLLYQCLEKALAPQNVEQNLPSDVAKSPNDVPVKKTSNVQKNIMFFEQGGKTEAELSETKNSPRFGRHK